MLLLGADSEQEKPGRADAPVTLGKGPYATRILVRRPRDAKRVSGTVIVEPFNPSADMDLPIMWAQSHQQWIQEGSAWVGITIKPNTLRALKLFDGKRYASLGFPNPRPAESCSTADINPLAGPTTLRDESGLAWDVLSQVGAALKSAGAVRILGRPASRLYMTGQSRSAGYARTNAAGGVRSTTVDVPVARYGGAKSGGFRCMFYGYKFAFDRETLRRSYPDRAAYLGKLRARADELVAERWLTTADRDELLKNATTEGF